MDLFPVERYLGDSKSNENDNDFAEENMRKLMLKIKKRSKAEISVETKEVSHSKTVPVPEKLLPSNTESIQVKKKKKKNHLLGEERPQNVAVIPNNLLEDELSRLNVEDNENNTTSVNYEEALDGDTKEVFPVLGDYKFKKKHKVKRVLPDWLANPSVVSVDLKNLKVSIHDIPDLHHTFKNILENNNISHFFPVQAQVIPWLLNSTKLASFFWPCDVCVSAPTGSGKTLAYVLPVLQALMGTRIGQIQALVVLPVQDLAAQVTAVFRCYSAGTGLRIHLSTGALPLQDDRTQLLKQRLGVGWESQVDILVITPGRLVEHLYSTPGFSLTHLRYIVIDEADRIIDNMQNNWLYHLEHHLSVQGSPQLTLRNLKSLPKRPQKLLFSATLSVDPEKLNQLNLFQPRLFTSVVEATKGKEAENEFIGEFTTPAELQERMVKCTMVVKPLVLYRLVMREHWSRVLVFTNSSRSVHQLSSLLTLLAAKTKQTLQVAEISAECSFKKREAVLAAFAAGKVDVLVSTDQLARGMDIPNVRYVISYDMPKFIKAYIHRIGRTGRAGQEGLAVTMVHHTQVGLFQQMLQAAGKLEAVSNLEVNQKELENLEMAFKSALKELKNVSEGEDVKKLNKAKFTKRGPLVKILPKKRKNKKSFGNVHKRIKLGS